MRKDTSTHTRLYEYYFRKCTRVYFKHHKHVILLYSLYLCMLCMNDALGHSSGDLAMRCAHTHTHYLFTHNEKKQPVVGADTDTHINTRALLYTRLANVCHQACVRVVYIIAIYITMRIPPTRALHTHHHTAHTYHHHHLSSHHHAIKSARAHARRSLKHLIVRRVRVHAIMSLEHCVAERAYQTVATTTRIMDWFCTP